MRSIPWKVLLGWTCLLAFSLWAVILNWSIIWLGMARRRRGSLAPLVGGLVGAVAVRLSPWPQMRPWWWIPLVLDPGSLLMLSGAAWILLSRLRGSSSTDRR